MLSAIADKDADGRIVRTLAVSIDVTERNRAEETVPGSIGLFEELLDADHDGEIGDDVTRLGAQLLGSLFRR